MKVEKEWLGICRCTDGDNVKHFYYRDYIDGIWCAHCNHRFHMWSEHPTVIAAFLMGGREAALLVLQRRKRE